jgi:hypothetical protein
MATRKVTINEAMEVQKQVNSRIAELTSLRNTNSASRSTGYGANQDRIERVEPKYSAVGLDKLINNLHKMSRTLSLAVKSTNQVTEVVGFDYDEDVLYADLPVAV